MEISLYGRCSQRSSCICPYLLLFRIRYSAFMEVCPLKSSNWIKSNLSIEFKIFLIKVLYVISYGQIQLMMIEKVLGHHQEELDIVGEKISVRNSYIKIIWRWSAELINWACKDTATHINKCVLQYSLPQTIATDAEMQHQYWKSEMTFHTTTRSTSHPQKRRRMSRQRKFLDISYDC